jgi:putative ABC transport system permease protein
LETKRNIPPKFAKRFLNWFLRDDLAEEVEGDLEEKFIAKLEKSTLFRAKLNYWYQVLNYLRPFAISKSSPTQIMQYAMFRNYFKVGWRNISRKPSNAFINIAGLSIGIAIVLLLVFHVKEELSYDQGFWNSRRIFRVTNENLGDNSRHWAATSPQMGPEMQQSLPEVAYCARFQRPYPYQLLSYTSAGNDTKQFEEKEGYFADAEVIEMFDIPFIHGNPRMALTEMNTIVLTEETAQKYFGEENPLGKTLVDNAKSLPLKVTGVIKNFPFQTHLKFDYLISMPTIKYYQDQESLENRGWAGFYTYVLLKDDHSLASVNSKLTDFMVAFYSPTGESREESIAARKLHLQPITDIHLRSKLEKEMTANSDITYVYIFSTIAALILLLATVNFTNINIAQSFDRMKEVGLRKVVGASKRQIVQQSLTESFVIIIIATGLALILLRLAIPYYENVISRSLHFQDFRTLSNVGYMFILLISVCLVAGMVPAMVLAKAQPVYSLKKKIAKGFSFSKFRNSLVIFQFVISVFMIVGTIVINGQMDLFHNRNLGFDKEQVLAVTMYPEMQKNSEAFTNKLSENPAIENYSMASRIPGQRLGTETFRLLSNSDEDISESSARLMWADEKYLSTLKIHLKQGKNFSNPKQQEFILNEVAVKEFDLKDPIGSRMAMGGNKGEIVGIVEDFNFASLHSAIEPLVIQYSPYPSNYLFVKVQPNKLPNVLAYAKESISEIFPGCTFSYSFVDEDLDRLYETESKMFTVFKAFTVLSILISCLGLYSISTYTTKRRTKEIGIRKVHGASAATITELLLKDFMKLVVLAVVVASPITYVIMQEWLQDFTYHVVIHWWDFAIAFGLILMITILTISFQSVRAALAKPVNSLRTE